MNYKYNIHHKEINKKQLINFKTKKSMITYLNKNIIKVNKMTNPVINFGAISLPLKVTVWNH
tara:strand:+ start:368 stop:553 length:186 start_codon:yes stop_codon:yes gene_type:complete